LRAIGWVSVGVGWSRWSADVQESKTAKKGLVTPRGTKSGFPKIAPPKFFWIWCHLPMFPKWGCKKHPPPCGPLRVQLHIVWFFAAEGEWGSGIGKGVCPAVCILGGGYGKAHRMYFCEGLSQKKRVALRAPPGWPLRDWHG